MKIPSQVTEERLSILIDGEIVECERGASVASVLLAQGHYAFSLHPVNSVPRGPFCMMGACQSCRVLIDNRWRLACQLEVRQGLCVHLNKDSQPHQSQPHQHA